MRSIKTVALVVLALVLAPLCFEAEAIASGGELQRVQEPPEGNQETLEAADEAKAEGESEVTEPVAPNDDGDGTPGEQQV